MSFKLKTNFYNDFKIGDNINHTFEVLNCLYKLSKQEESKKELMCKPIIIFNVSIIEAILADFFNRINKNHNEGVHGLSTWEVMRGKKIDDFTKYIVHAKKEDIFEQHSSKFYETLEYLKAVRNRVHIQDSYRKSKIQSKLSRNDSGVYTLTYLRCSERCLEYLVKKMIEKYPRPSYLNGHVGNHIIPWKEHFPNYPSLD